MMARVDRLDLVLGYLEEMHHQQHQSSNTMSTSSPSTPTLSADSSSAASTPRGSGSARSCRPANEVLEEAHAKGSLVDRIAFLEDRVLKMEGDMEITPDQRKEKVHPNKKKGLKSLVKSCVRGKLKTKD
ncbi:hypothetical protein EJB05_00040, partial [Eragrostis curvula]